MPDSVEISNLREEVRRVEDRIEKRLNRMDDEAQVWRMRTEAQSDNRHKDNLERFKKLEDTISQGVGAMVALRAGWAFLIGVGGIVIGYLTHKVGN